MHGLFKVTITEGRVVFGWFRKKAVTREQDTEAFKLGRRMAAEAVSAFEKVMESRFGHLHDDFLDVLRGAFQTDIQRTDAPPMTSARINYKIFLKNVEGLKPQMNAEIAAYMSGWLETADEAGIRPQLEQFFQQEVGNFCGGLTIDGLKLFTDYAIPLKDADDAWRKANPELAENFPEE
jgi:hypothetical protein